MGASWTNICQTPFVLNVKKVNNTILAATDTGLIRTTNNGLNWFATPVMTGIDKCAIEENSNGDIWSPGKKKLYKSIDDGVTFDSTDLIDFIYVDRNNLFIMDSVVFFGDLVLGKGIHYTTDYGQTWNNEYRNRTINSVNGNGVYIIAGTSKDIIYTLNYGLTLDSLDYPIDFYGYISEIEYDKNGKLYFGTSSSGLFEMDFIVGIDEDIPIEPKDFEVYDLYPNPFNSTVNLIYNLPYSSEIKISVNNVLGERMSVNEFFRFAGNNYEQISFDGLVSGVYFISIECRDFFVVKKAVFLK
jgi:hypothetical protein